MKSQAKAILLAAILLASARSAAAQTLGTTPNTLSTISDVPPSAPYPTTYGGGSSSLRFGPNGQLYASDGSTVWEQTAGFGGSFTAIGAIQTAGSDPGEINFSSDNQSIIVSNGAGGPAGGSANGVLYSLPLPNNTTAPTVLPTASQIGTVQNNFDLVPTPLNSNFTNPASSYLVDLGVGDSYDASQVDFFNSSTGPVAAIINIPGASSSLAITGAGASNDQLYVDVGSGNSQGEIKAFSLSSLATAVATNTPLDWNTQGTVVNGPDANNSGLGMFVDPRGYVFTGGPYGIEVIVPPSTAGGSSTAYVYGIPDTNGDLLTYDSVTYNPITNQFVVQGYDPSYNVYTNVYSASQFVTNNLLNWTGAANNSWDISGTYNWSNNGSQSTYTEGDTVMFGDTNPNTGALVPNTNGTATIQIASNGVAPAAVMFTNTGGANGLNYLITGGPIGGSATIELYGNGTVGGTVTLANSNTFSGAVIVAAGILNLQNPMALGNSSGASVVAGAVIQLQPTTSGATFGLAANGSGTIPVNLYGTGISSGAGELQSVAGNNTYAGPINVGSGGGQIVSSSIASGDRLTLSGGVNVAAGSQLAFAGPGTTVVSGAGLTLASASSIDVVSGTLRIAVSSGSGAIGLGTGTTMNVAPAATLQLAGAVSALSDPSTGNVANIVNDGSTASGGGLTIASGNQTVGSITGQAGSTGTASTYSGDTTVAPGANLGATQILQNSLIVGADSIVTIEPIGGSVNGSDAATGAAGVAASNAVPDANSSGTASSGDAIETAIASEDAAGSNGENPASQSTPLAADDAEMSFEIERMENRVAVFARLAAMDSAYNAPLAAAENVLFSLEDSAGIPTSDGSLDSTSLLTPSGEIAGGAAAVPEPAAFALALLAGSLCIAWTIRRRGN